MPPFGPRKRKPEPTPERRPPMPPTEPGCTCGPWTFVNGHWTRVLDPDCPVHAD